MFYIFCPSLQDSFLFIPSCCILNSFRIWWLFLTILFACFCVSSALNFIYSFWIFFSDFLNCFWIAFFFYFCISSLHIPIRDIFNNSQLLTKKISSSLMRRQTHALLRDVRAVHIKPLKELLLANIPSPSSDDFSFCSSSLMQPFSLLAVFCSQNISCYTSPGLRNNHPSSKPQLFLISELSQSLKKGYSSPLIMVPAEGTWNQICKHMGWVKAFSETALVGAGRIRLLFL